tara:strand:+ start:296 stop:769 length:474 start_codon:yes stop_codon:yes gene_type:complete
MKKTVFIFVCILIVISLKCTTKNDIDYKIIDKKIECYQNATSLFKFISEDKNDDYQREVFKAVNEFMIHLDYMSNKLMKNNSNRKERLNTLNTLNLFIKNNTKKCVAKLGEFDLRSSSDSNYYYNMKINYIECILNTSNTIDSVNLICDKDILGNFE